MSSEEKTEFSSLEKNLKDGKDLIPTLEKIGDLCRVASNREIYIKLLPEITKILYDKTKKNLKYQVFRVFANLCVNHEKNVNKIFKEVKELPVYVFETLDDESMYRKVEFRNLMAFMTNFFHCTEEIRISYLEQKFLKKILNILQKIKDVDMKTDKFMVLFHTLKATTNLLYSKESCKKFIKLGALQFLLELILKFSKLSKKKEDFDEKSFECVLEILSYLDTFLTGADGRKIIVLNLMPFIDYPESPWYIGYLLILITYSDKKVETMFEFGIPKKFISFLSNEKIPLNTMSKIVDGITNSARDVKVIPKLFDLGIIEGIKKVMSKKELGRNIVRLLGHIALTKDEDLLHKFIDNDIVKLVNKLCGTPEIRVKKNAITVVGNMARSTKNNVFFLECGTLDIVKNMILKVDSLLKKPPKELSFGERFMVDPDLQFRVSIALMNLLKIRSRKHEKILLKEKEIDKVLKIMMKSKSQFFNYFGVMGLYNFCYENEELKKDLLTEFTPILMEVFLKTKEGKLKGKVVEILCMYIDYDTENDKSCAKVIKLNSKFIDGFKVFRKDYKEGVKNVQEFGKLIDKLYDGLDIIEEDDVPPLGSED